MKKITSLLLIFSLFSVHFTTVYADSSLSEKGVDSDKEIISPISRSVEDSNKSIEKKNPSKKNLKKISYQKRSLKSFLLR